VERILGLDWGKRRIGVAISDPLGITAQPVSVWENRDEKGIVQKLLQLIEREKIQCVIIGRPLHLNGAKGKSAAQVEQFAKRLRPYIQIPIILWDERLTSVQARRSLHQMNEKPSRNKGRVDVIAATLLLQNYLDYLKDGFMMNNKEND